MKKKWNPNNLNEDDAMRFFNETLKESSNIVAIIPIAGDVEDWLENNVDQDYFWAHFRRGENYLDAAFNDLIEAGFEFGADFDLMTAGDLTNPTQSIFGLFDQSEIDDLFGDEGDDSDLFYGEE